MGNCELLNKMNKKFSEEDLEYWDRLKKTIDFKFYKKSYQITELKKAKLFSKEQNKVENYKLKQNKIVKHSIENKKFLNNNNQLQDIRIDKNKLNLLKRGKIKPEKTLDLHGLTSFEAKKKVIEFYFTKIIDT